MKPIARLVILLACADPSTSFAATRSRATAAAPIFPSAPMGSSSPPPSAPPKMMLPPHLASSDSLLSSLDPSARAPDVARAAAVAIAGIATLLSAAALYATKVVLPRKMDDLSRMIAIEDPNRWEDIRSRLGDGERLTDRPDLMAELVDAGVSLMAEEGEAETRRLAELVREHLEGGGDTEALRRPLEEAFGTTVGDFVRRVDRNRSSRLQTDADRELAELLRAEFGGGGGAPAKGGQGGGGLGEMRARGGERRALRDPEGAERGGTTTLPRIIQAGGAGG